MSHEANSGDIEAVQELVNVGTIVLRQGDLFILQYRDPKVQKGATDLIGGVGGTMEDIDNKNFWNTARRETSEEVLVGDSPEAAKPFWVGEYSHVCQKEVRVESDRDGEQILVDAWVFEVPIDKKIKLIAKEGELLTMTFDEVAEAKSQNKLTPVLAKYMEEMYDL
jgi:hypothetical protein